MKTFATFCIILQFTTFFNDVFAQEYRADRPQLTLSGDIVPIKTFAVESGFRSYIVDKNEYEFNYNQTWIRIGMMKLMEMTIGIRVPATIMNAQHEIGLASPKLGLKVFLKQKEAGVKMGIAFIFEGSINFGTDNFKDAKFLPSFRVAADVDFNESTNLRLNYGAEWRENRKIIDPEGNPVIDPFIVLAANLNQDFGEKVTGFVEVFISFKYNDIKSDYIFNGGLIIKPKNNFHIDLSAGAGLSPESPRGIVQVGLSGLWPKRNIPVKE